jgi:hypothetical protein
MELIGTLSVFDQTFSVRRANYYFPALRSALASSLALKQEAVNILHTRAGSILFDFKIVGEFFVLFCFVAQKKSEKPNCSIQSNMRHSFDTKRHKIGLVCVCVCPHTL